MARCLKCGAARGACSARAAHVPLARATRELTCAPSYVLGRARAGALDLAARGATHATAGAPGAAPGSPAAAAAPPARAPAAWPRRPRVRRAVAPLPAPAPPWSPAACPHPPWLRVLGAARASETAACGRSARAGNEAGASAFKLGQFLLWARACRGQARRHPAQRARMRWLAAGTHTQQPAHRSQHRSACDACRCADVQRLERAESHCLFACGRRASKV